MASISVQTFDGTGALDANWTNDFGGFARVSDKAEPTTANQQNETRWSAAQMDSANHWVQGTLGGREYSNHGNVVFRRHATAGTRTYYNLEFQATDTWRINKRVAGSLTTLDTAIVATSNNGPCVAKASINGWDLLCYCDEVEISGLNLNGDTAIDGSAGNYVGMSSYNNVGGRIDDFSAADLAAGGGTILPQMMEHHGG